jgi:uncharacterized membrane protein YhfC
MFSHSVMLLDRWTAVGLGLAAGLCLVGPVLLAQWWRRRTSTSLAAFGAGALVFFVSQVVLRMPWQVPLGRWVSAHQRWMVPFLIFSALTAALFEETGRYLGYRYLIRERNRRVAVMFGLGHGGLEAMLVVGLPFAGLLLAWVLAERGSLPPAALATVQRQVARMSFWGAQIAVMERASAIAMHVGLSLIVLQVFTRRALRWLLLAMAVHVVANMIAVTMIEVVRLQPVIAELVLVGLAAAVLIGGSRLAAESRSAP